MLQRLKMFFKIVDLPEPLGLIRATILLGSTTKSMPFNTSVPLYPDLREFIWSIL
ncbi:MAG: hypothetical protein Q7S21_02855 [archaeon]|nr:hypothetical protein [archaeon]